MLSDIQITITDSDTPDTRLVEVVHKGKRAAHVMPWPFTTHSNDDAYAQFFMLGTVCWEAILHPCSVWASDLTALELDPERVKAELREAR